MKDRRNRRLAKLLRGIAIAALALPVVPFAVMASGCCMRGRAVPMVQQQHHQHHPCCAAHRGPAPTARRVATVGRDVPIAAPAAARIVRLRADRVRFGSDRVAVPFFAPLATIQLRI